LVEKRKTLTTKAPRHQGKNHREVREVREEKTFSPPRHKGHKGGKMQGIRKEVTEEGSALD
jgi:hypothetical protein